MSIRVYIGGRIVSPEEASISVLDRGFLFGDSVFETLGTVNGQPHALDAHLARLERSAARIGLQTPPRPVIAAATLGTVKAAGNQETRIRIVVTRGPATDLDPASAGDPTWLVIAQPLAPPTEDQRRQGVAAEVVSVVRNSPSSTDPAVKSGNYLNNVLALGEARRRNPGAHEAFMCNSAGSVAEGASSNIFVVRSGVIMTPALCVGILAGITRGEVLDLARSNDMPCQQLDFLAPADLRGADEIFITSAVRGLLPVTILDGRPVGTGAVGPVSTTMASLHRAYVTKDHP